MNLRQAGCCGQKLGLAKKIKKVALGWRIRHRKNGQTQVTSGTGRTSKLSGGRTGLRRRIGKSPWNRLSIVSTFSGTLIA